MTIDGAYFIIWNHNGTLKLVWIGILRLCIFKKLAIASIYEFSEINKFTHNLHEFSYLVLSKYSCFLIFSSYPIKALELSKFIWAARKSSVTSYNMIIKSRRQNFKFSKLYLQRRLYFLNFVCLSFERHSLSVWQFIYYKKISNFWIRFKI